MNSNLSSILQQYKLESLLKSKNLFGGWGGFDNMCLEIVVSGGLRKMLSLSCLFC